jgi:hypothetical protein
MGEVDFPDSYSELRMETMYARNAPYFAPDVSLRSMGPCRRASDFHAAAIHEYRQVQGIPVRFSVNYL